MNDSSRDQLTDDGGERAIDPDPFTLIAFAMIVIVTIGWWMAALWPLPPTTPEWVVRARAACFGSSMNGLPNSGGWILLIGTPLTMIGALLLVAPVESRRSLAAIGRPGRGRWLGGGIAAVLLMLGILAATRVGQLYGLGSVGSVRTEVAAGPARLGARSSRPAPPLELLDHRGAVIRIGDFRGRVVVVTFAYGKCETVCPVVVHNVLAARQQLPASDLAVLIVTLDPWRDTPQRLPHIAESWGLPTASHLLGGDIDRVEATLDAWGVERARDSRTGDISHASIAFIVDREGRIAFVTSSAPDHIIDAVGRL